jgi:hypothetical protein
MLRVISGPTSLKSNKISKFNVFNNNVIKLISEFDNCKANCTNIKALYNSGFAILISKRSIIIVFKAIIKLLTNEIALLLLLLQM